MNIQIFGTNKSFDTKKAMRYFKERNIPYQFVDLKEKGLSKGELRSVANAAQGLDKLINEKSKDTEALALIKYLSDEDKFEKVLENPKLLVDPVVRNGKQATAGYQPEVWKTWQ